MMHLWEADILAEAAHRGQVDKLGEPYIEHVRAVAAGLVDFKLEIQIAGLLHDVVEDTDWTLEGLLRAGVPRASVRIIQAVTKLPGMTRKQQIDQVVQAGWGAVAVKCADNAHNSHPSRMAQLDRETCERLEGKYRTAREVLWQRIEPGDLKKILTIVNPFLMPEAQRFRTSRRPDVPARDVALKWLAGGSIVDISTEYDCSVSTIEARLRKARSEFPELPWSDRQKEAHVDRPGEYIRMNDGRPGESQVREGSIVRGRGMPLRRGI